MLDALHPSLHPSLLPLVPPGEDDLPCDDGEPMETEQHRRQMTLLLESLELCWRDRTDFYAGGNMALYFSELQTKKNDFRGPDVFVVLDTIRRVRKSWVVWQEDGRSPDVVIELLSESTEQVDRGDKMRVYAKLLRVPFYGLFDPLTGTLEGYMLDTATRSYRRIAPRPDGDIPCAPLKLSLGVRRGVYQQVEGDWLRWIDEDHRVLPTSEEHARAAEEHARAAEARTEQEARLREEVERKLAEAMAELEQLRGSRAKD